MTTEEYNLNFDENFAFITYAEHLQIKDIEEALIKNKIITCTQADDKN